MTERVLAVVTSAFAKQHGVGKRFGYDEDLVAAGVMDSFAVWAALADIEKELGVQVPDGENTLAQFCSVSKAVAYFEALLLKSRAG